MKFIFKSIATLLGLLLLAAAYSGWVNPAQWALPAVLGLAMPVVLVVVFVATLFMLVMRQWRAAAILVFCAVLAWPVIELLVPLRGATDIPTTATTFRVITYNVAGFDLEAKTLRYILDQDADFVMLQETSLAPMDFTDLPQHVDLRDELEQKYPYHSRGYHDLAIMSKLPYTVLGDTTLRQRPDGESNEYHFYAKAFNLQLAGQPLTIVNVHLQSIGLNDDDKELYKRLTRSDIDNHHDLKRVKASLVSKLQGAYSRRAGEAQQLRYIINDTIAMPNLIVCGDFNDTPGSFCYRTVRGKDMRDAFAECGTWPTYTFNRDRFYFKIDHILYRGNLKAMNISCDHQGGSDHYPQVVTFAIKN